MTFNPRVRIRDDPRHHQYDGIIAALGYEARATYIAQHVTAAREHRLALSFESRGVLSFDKNEQLFVELGYVLSPLSHQEWVASVTDFLTSISAPIDGVPRIAIDISCLTRLHLATLVEALASLPESSAVSVDFLYAPASSDEWINEPVMIQVAEPVHPAFVSWSDDPSWPLTAIIGVGAEDTLALGVAEYLDVAAVYAYAPYGLDAKFDSLSEKANRQFFVEDYLVRRSEYNVLQPFELFARLESLVYGLSEESRIAIVPLGPKVFALCALLVATSSSDAVTIWRFSSGSSHTPVERWAAEAIVSLRVEFNLS